MEHIRALSLFILLSSSLAQAQPIFNVTLVSCAGNDGALRVSPNFGVAPHTRLWSTGATSPSIHGLAPGTYSVTITDSEGTVVTATKVLEPYDADAFEVMVSESVDPCVDECNGRVLLQLPNYLEAYVITVDPPQPFALVSSFQVNEQRSIQYGGFCDGSTVQLTATNSCHTLGPFSVTFDHSPSPEVDIQVAAASCGSADDGYVAGVITVHPNGNYGWGEYWLGQGELIVDGFYMAEPGTYDFYADGLGVGDWVVNLRETSTNECRFEYPIRIADRSPDCATLNGTVHYTTDTDCVFDAQEFGIPNQLMRVMPGAYYGITGPDGSFRVAVPNGDFAVDQVNPDVVQICPPTGAVPFTVGFNGSATVDFADSVLTPFDQRIHLWYDISRVGFPFTYSMTLSNDNGYVGENVVVELAYDPTFTFVSATAGVSTNDPGLIQWTFPNLAPFEQRVIELTVQVPPDPDLLGNSYSATTTVSSTTAEVDLSDNSGSLTHEIVGSYDPNDKQAFTSSRTSEEMYLKDLDSYVDYLIRFQNTGNDTAFTVVVQDTISPLLDMASLQVLGASHAFTPSIEAGNVLQFQFNDILLPDSNVNEVESHGFVAFRMKPVDNGVLGTRIDNAADIYFDFNEPVRTNTASLQVSLSTAIAEGIPSTIRLSPVPTTDQLTLHYEGVTTSISIQSLDGRTVLELPGTPTIDVASLSAGVYLLQARTERGEVLQARFVKR